jgi:hypothetical protein
MAKIEKARSVMSQSTPVISRNRLAAERKKERATQPLPTSRIAFPKQIDILRGFAAACGSTPRVVSNIEVGKIVDMHPNTISLANAFFASIGLLERGDGGNIPAAEVLSMNRAFEWDAQAALHKLAPALARAWFAQAVFPKLQLRPRDENEVITELGEAASVGPGARPQLRLVLDYMETAGLIVRENGQVRLARTADQESSEDKERPMPSVNGRGGHPQDERPPTVSTAFAKAREGSVQFSFNIDVDMKEMGTWAPERIAAFFAGIAAVLAAKGSLEKAEAK